MDSYVPILVNLPYLLIDLAFLSGILYGLSKKSVPGLILMLIGKILSIICIFANIWLTFMAIDGRGYSAVTKGMGAVSIIGIVGQILFCVGLIMILVDYVKPPALAPTHPQD